MTIFQACTVLGCLLVFSAFLSPMLQRSPACPANLNSDAQIVLCGDRMSPSTSNCWFGYQSGILQRILRFDDARIQHETQNAFNSSMKGLAWSSLSLSLMSWASASSKMPPFNLLATDTVLVVWPSIAGLLQETARQNALLYLLVDIVLTLPESRHWE